MSDHHPTTMTANNNAGEPGNKTAKIDRLTPLPEELLETIASYLYGKDFSALRQTCKAAQDKISSLFKNRPCRCLVIKLRGNPVEELEVVADLLATKLFAESVRKIHVRHFDSGPKDVKYYGKVFSDLLKDLPVKMDIEVEGDNLPSARDGATASPAVDGFLGALSKSAKQIGSLKITSLNLGKYNFKNLLSAQRSKLWSLDLQLLMLQYGSWGNMLRSFVDGNLSYLHLFYLEVATEPEEVESFSDHKIVETLEDGETGEVESVELDNHMARLSGSMIIKKTLKTIFRRRLYGIGGKDYHGIWSVSSGWPQSTIHGGSRSVTIRRQS